MELIKRYIYAVTKSLPEKQRADIEQELQGLIEDMLEERDPEGNATRQDVEAVLRELGHPSKLADKYRENKRYLIGPEFFSHYILVLKIAFISFGIAMAVLFTVETVMSPPDMIKNLTDTLVTLITGSFQVFGWVTIVFAFLEYAGVPNEKLGSKNDRSWRPSDLPPVPEPKTLIKRSDPIASIIFTVLLGALFTFSMDWFGVWFNPNDDARAVVPFFDEARFNVFLPFILIVLAVTVLKEILKLIAGRWSLKLIALDIVVTVLHFVLALFMFADLTIWNPEFIQQLAINFSMQPGSEAYVSIDKSWTTFKEGFIYLVGVTVAIQVIVVAVKAFRIKNFKEERQQNAKNVR